MTNINAIKTLIKNRIVSQVTDIQDVSTYDKTVFDGFPAITITCSENENAYFSNAENMRVFAFRVTVFEQIGTDITNDSAKKRAEEVVADTVSAIIDTLDDYSDSTDLAQGYIHAVPSIWGYTQIGEGYARFADITIKVSQIYLLT